jgi:hypothetical protein
MMEDKIKLVTHDGSRNYLKKLNVPTYDNHQAYVLDAQYNHIRYILGTDNKTIVSADPPGGPMLNVGSTVYGTNYRVANIECVKYVGTVVILEKIEQS